MASVAHALAYCHAMERLAGVSRALARPAWSGCCTPSSSGWPRTWTPPSGWPTPRAWRWPPPGSALHKEQVARLVSRMCGSRFGRGVVVPGGVGALPQLSAAEFRAEIGRLERSITADARVLMGTASFLDRLRRTGPLRPERAREHGALGPVGKASGFSDDARRHRPYDAYPSLGLTGLRRAHRRRRAGQAPGPLGRGAPVVPPAAAGRRRAGRGERWPAAGAVRGQQRAGDRLGRGAAGRGALRRAP